MPKGVTMPIKRSHHSGTAWIDDDGVHVWLQHFCVDGDERMMLPLTWRAIGNRVETSVNCQLCGYHSFPLIRGAPISVNI